MIKILFLVPLVLGFVGYHFYGGLDVAGALYAALLLYFANPANDFTNVLIYIAKYSALIASSGIVISIITKAKAVILHIWKNLFKDSTVVFADSLEEGGMIAGNLKHGYVGNAIGKRVDRAKRVILFYLDDLKNLDYVCQHKTQLRDKEIFIRTNDVDMDLLRPHKDRESNIHFFSYPDLVARTYWAENNLYNQIVDMASDKPYKMSIIGYGPIGKALFKRAFLTNLFNLEQSIEYHVFGCPGIEGEFIAGLNTMNKDKIIVYPENEEFNLKQVSGMDRVIVADCNNPLQIVQQLVLYCPGLCIHCFHTGSQKYEYFFGLDTIKTFGNMAEVLTEENVIGEKLQFNAKLFNYDYVYSKTKREKEKPNLTNAELEWNKLSGFHKDSNMARADFYPIEKKLINEGKASRAAVRELEHIRWSRFHFINHWQYNEKRDNSLRHHNLLIPFDNLSDEEKNKDDFPCPEIEKIMIDYHGASF